MKVRYFGILFMVVVVAAPIGVLAFLATKRAERTAVLEVRTGNARLARAVANQITSYVTSEREAIVAHGEVLAQTSDELLREKFRQAFLTKNRHVKHIALYGTDGGLIAGDAELRQGLEAALQGKRTRSSVPQQAGDAALGHMVHLAEPIVVAGRQRGAVLALVDLVGIWEPVSSVKIGRTGFVRLLTTGGVLLAHGDSEENRGVDAPGADVSARLVAAAFAGQLVRNKQGEAVIATAALVSEIDSIVLVEQPAAEAYASVGSMKVQLIVIAGATLLFAMLLGFVFGGHIVRGIERLRRHTQVLAKGELQKTIEPTEIARVKEIRELAVAVNEMAGELDTLQAEMKERARVDTFARVAAGLAHDLRHPIEAIRGACTELVEDPDDPLAREQVTLVSRKHLPRLARFMDDLSRLAREGQIELELEEHDPLELARAVVAEIGSSPKFAKMVTFEATGESGWFDVDPHLVKRALYNLANNGGEACMEQGPGGRVAIDVSIADGIVSLAVSDTGAGIAPERHAEVLSSSLKSTKRSNGVGLGLGVVRQVAESHGGELGLESDVGEGSTFTLFLEGRAVVSDYMEEIDAPEAQAV